QRIQRVDEVTHLSAGKNVFVLSGTVVRHCPARRKGSALVIETGGQFVIPGGDRIPVTLCDVVQHRNGLPSCRVGVTAVLVVLRRTVNELGHPVCTGVRVLCVNVVPGFTHFYVVQRGPFCTGRPPALRCRLLKSSIS